MVTLIFSNSYWTMELLPMIRLGYQVGTNLRKHCLLNWQHAYWDPSTKLRNTYGQLPSYEKLPLGKFGSAQGQQSTTERYLLLGYTFIFR